MKLKQITENIKNSKEPVRGAAEALGNLIRYVYGMGKSDELIALDKFLQHPSPRAWEATKWIVDSIQQKQARNETGHQDPAIIDQMRNFADLNTLTSPIVSAAVYDISPRDARGTPAEHTALSKPLRDKLKLALGPQGYVSALSEIGDIDDNKAKALLKATSKSGKGLAKAAATDLPGVARRPLKKF